MHNLMALAARGALFEKTAPLDPPQKLLIKGGHGLQPERIFRQTMTAFGLFKKRRLKRRLKASIPGVQATSHQSHDILHFAAFSDDSIQSKKPSGGPKGLIGPPCHGVRFFIKTYGCQMNVNDSEKMRHILERKGLLASDSEDDADIIIINSCAVREKPQEKVFSYAGRMGNDKKVIAAGCVAQAEKRNILERSPNIDYVVGTHQYYKIDEIVDEIIEKKQAGGVKTGFSRQWQEAVPDIASRISQVSGYISIMEGCDNFCSYCIVPFTRGREKHRPFKKIIEEAESLAANGYKEIILLGQNVNNWEDKKENMKFTHLLDIMAQCIDVKWIRFITSYPGYYDDELIEVMAAHRNIARSIHFPAQSGSTRILKKMNRIYTGPQYLDIIHKIKNKVPGITISSDFIVGYPGETDNDFRLTLSLVERVEYENIFSFVYSPRQHTKAFKMTDNISLEIKKKRLYELQEVQKRIQLKNNKALIGKTVEVLVTAKNPKKEGEVIGRTESYRVVNFQSETAIGEFTHVLVENVGPYSLRGKEVGPRNTQKVIVSSFI